MHGLQRLGHHHHVEAVAGEVAQAQVEVLLDDVDARVDAGGDVVRVDFQAVAADLLVIAQPGQQLAIAAAEVENSAAGRNPLLDDVQIGAHLRSLYGYAVHVTAERSEEHTSELQSLMRISYAVFCLKNKNTPKRKQ